MITESYNTLKDFLKEMKSEEEELDVQIEYNVRRIREADIYMKGFRDAELEDYKIFSPRNSENLHRDEIEKTSKEKQAYEEEIQNLRHRKAALSTKIHQLEKILKRENHNLTCFNIQEQDRQRIARELHDTSLQNLTHLVHKIELSSKYIDTDPVQAKLELSLVNKSLRSSIDDIRDIIYDLRPMTFDDLGMKTVLERLLENLRDEKNIQVDYSIEDVSCETNLVMLSIYRIVQESVHNIVKHANANKIVFCLKVVKDRCIMDIEDDGVGFKVNSIDYRKHFGLSLMRERVEVLNGKLKIQSKKGCGTKIHVEVPLV